MQLQLPVCRIVPVLRKYPRRLDLFLASVSVCGFLLTTSPVPIVHLQSIAFSVTPMTLTQHPSEASLVVGNQAVVAYAHFQYKILRL